MPFIELTIRAFGVQHNVAVSDSVAVSDAATPAYVKLVAVSDSVSVDDVFGDIQDILGGIEFVLDAGFTIQDTSTDKVISYFSPQQTVTQASPSSQASATNVDFAFNNQPTNDLETAVYNLNDMSALTEGEIFWVGKALPGFLDVDNGIWNLGNGGASSFPDVNHAVKLSFGSSNRKTVPGLLIPNDLYTLAIWNIRAKSNEWVLTKNGVNVFQDFVNTVQFPSNPYVFANTASGYWQATLGIMVCCHQLQTIAQRKAMLNYLSKRFNVAVTMGFWATADVTLATDNAAATDGVVVSQTKHITLSDSMSVSDEAWQLRYPVTTDSYSELLGGNLIALWHSQSGVSTFSVDNVSDWVDVVGSFHMAPPGIAPKYGADGSEYNGKSVLKFPTRSQSLEYSSSLVAANSRPYVFCLCRWYDISGVYMYVWYLNDGQDMVLYSPGVGSGKVAQFKSPSIAYAIGGNLDMNVDFIEAYLDGTNGHLVQDGVDNIVATTGDITPAINKVVLGPYNTPGSVSVYLWGLCASLPTRDQIRSLRDLVAVDVAS